MTATITPLPNLNQGAARIQQRSAAINAQLQTARHVLLNPGIFTHDVIARYRDLLLRFGTPSERELMALDLCDETGQTIGLPCDNSPAQLVPLEGVVS